MIIFSIYINSKFNFFLFEQDILRKQKHNYFNFWTPIDFNRDNYILWIMLIYYLYQIYIIYFLLKINTTHGTLRGQKPFQKLPKISSDQKNITTFFVHHEVALRANIPVYWGCTVLGKPKFRANSWYLIAQV